MTFRAVVIGIIFALFFVTAGYINDHYVCVNLSVGNHLPISIFGMLVIAMVVINPLLWRLRPRWRFRPAEVAVSLAIILMPCGIVSSGFLRTFTPALLLPIHYNQITPGWRKHAVLDYAPRSVLPGNGEFNQELVTGFISGVGNGRDGIALNQVPWSYWAGPLLTWLPLVALLLFCMICLSLVLHPQWAHRERLRYPIADFAATLIQQDPDRATGPIFRNRWFWIGLLVVLAIRVVNGLYVWFPEHIQQIPLTFDLWPIQGKYRILSTFSWPTLAPAIYPAAVGFTFFLASEISFSVGVVSIFYTAIMTILLVAGVEVSGSFVKGGFCSWINFGAFLGFIPMLIYIARNYYGRLVKNVFSLRKDPEVEGYGIWAFRGLLIGLAAMIVILTRIGLDWPLSTMVVLAITVLFIVQARINTECGIFFYQSGWQPLGAFVGMFGLSCLGPKAVVLIGLVTIVLTLDTRECLIPFIMNSLKLSDRVGVRPAAIGSTAMAVLGLCLATGVPLALWANYSFGLQEPRDPYKWTTSQVPKFSFDAAAKAATELELQGELEKVNQLSPMERLARIQPQRGFLWAAGAGAAAALLLNAMRLRFPWWPLHPIFALCFGCWTVQVFSPSFLLGWLLKITAVRMGGAKFFEQARKFMVGVIAGDLLGGLIFMLAGWLYYVTTGLMPPEYRIFPG